MGILMIIIATISKSFQLIIHHKSNFNLESFLVVCMYVCMYVLHPFNNFFLGLFVVNLSNELIFTLYVFVFVFVLWGVFFSFLFVID
jgi:hypothetical protein